MKKTKSIEYDTYREIMDELLLPIDAEGLDVDTLKRLYESKLVYLENLRTKCFREMNKGEMSFFTVKDYELVLSAIKSATHHLRSIVVVAVTKGLERRKIG